MCPLYRLAFPNLSDTNHRLTSAASRRYNCIAFAAGDETRWWWPVPVGPAYWPPQTPRIVSLAAFVSAFETLGFKQCASPAIERGVDKIAIYVKDMKPSHAAKQLPNGRWASKLGVYEDIEHDTPNLLEGDEYGTTILYMRRVDAQSVIGIEATVTVSPKAGS